MFDLSFVQFSNVMTLSVAMVMIPLCYWFPSSFVWDTKKQISEMKESGYLRFLPDAEVSLADYRRLRVVMMSIVLVGYSGLFLWINFYL
jgi:hypothetical protein